MPKPTSVDRIRLTTGQAIVRYLAAQFSERDGTRRRVVPAMFAIFGHGNVCGLGQALEQDRDLMRYHQPKNEQAMVHTAIGYAKANDRLATIACSASIGPGATNMVTGAATATVNRVPVLLFPSDTFATRLQGPPMQSLDDPFSADMSVNDCFRPVSRFFDRITRPEQLLSSLPQAIRALLDPEHTGAVTVSLHQDVQAQASDFPVEFFAERTWHVNRRPPDPAEIEAAAGVLRDAERPLVIAGGGVHYSDASDALLTLAEQLAAPVAETSAGKGALVDHRLSVGGVGHSGSRAANTLARRADVVVCVGTRLIDLTTGSNSLFENPEVRFIGLNVSGADAHKLGGMPIVADAREGLLALADACRGRSPRDGWGNAVDEAKTSWRNELEVDVAQRRDERMSQGQVLRALNAHAGADDALVVASGTPHVDVHKLFDCSRGTRVYMEVGFSCMGHEIPAALGVRMAERHAGEVFAVIGDGTYLMASSELLTAAQEGRKITVVVFENHGYQSIHALQRSRIGRSFGLEFRSRSDGESGELDGPYVELDLAANAASYGSRVFVCDTLAQVSDALDAARSEERACVVVARVEPRRLLLDSQCWWDVGVPEVAERPETREAVANSDRGRSLQRYFG